MLAMPVCAPVPQDTLYVIVPPPGLAGAVQLTTIVLGLIEVVSPCGGPGGTHDKAFCGAAGTGLPSGPLELTVKVYFVPQVRRVIWTDVVPVLFCVPPDGLTVTW